MLSEKLFDIILSPRFPLLHIKISLISINFAVALAKDLGIVALLLWSLGKRSSLATESEKFQR